MSKEEEEEKFKNLIWFGTPVTDKEMEEMSPIFGLIVIVLIVGAVGYWIFS